ncbi:hypothetical protein D3C83_140540 [compost metagenome]
MPERHAEREAQGNARAVMVMAMPGERGRRREDCRQGCSEDECDAGFFHGSPLGQKHSPGGSRQADILVMKCFNL